MLSHPKPTLWEPKDISDEELVSPVFKEAAEKVKTSLAIRQHNRSAAKNGRGMVSLIP